MCAGAISWVIAERRDADLMAIQQRLLFGHGRDDVNQKYVVGEQLSLRHGTDGLGCEPGTTFNCEQIAAGTSQ